jgi:hypothetical protein
MVELRSGEVLLNQCAGGPCAVCKQRISPGPAVQLSKRSNRIRHVDCMPQTDTRRGNGGKDRKLERFLHSTRRKVPDHVREENQE